MIEDILHETSVSHHAMLVVWSQYTTCHRGRRSGVDADNPLLKKLIIPRHRIEGVYVSIRSVESVNAWV